MVSDIWDNLDQASFDLVSRLLILDMFFFKYKDFWTICLLGHCIPFHLLNHLQEGEVTKDLVVGTRLNQFVALNSLRRQVALATFYLFQPLIRFF